MSISECFENTTFKSAHLKTLDAENVLNLFPSKDSSVGGSSRYVQHVKFFELDDLQCVVALKHPAEVYFRGVLDIFCVVGTAEIHGFTISPSEAHDSVRAYSLTGQAALYVSSVEGTLPPDFVYSKRLLNFGIPENICSSLERTFIGASTILIVKKCCDNVLRFVSERMNLNLFPSLLNFNGNRFFSDAEDLLDCVFDIPGGNRILSRMIYDPAWKRLCECFQKTETPRILVCGGKNVGKSTLLKYLINNMLKIANRVIYIDFDIGQPEFTVSGCVSVVLVEKPLLGPSYTHLQKPLKSIFLGCVNPNDCAQAFLEAVHEMKQFCNEMPDLCSYPWFINTMGYTKGFGEILTLEIIKLFNLSSVIQLHSQKNTKVNFENKLTHMYVRKRCELLFEDYLQYRLEFLITPDSPSGRKKSEWLISPKVTREIRALIYLSKGFNIFESDFKLFSNFKNVIQLKKDDIVFTSQLPLQDILSVVQGREMVALCTERKVCLGFGVVLPYSTDLIHIVTPLDSQQAKDITFIVRGELGLDHNLVKDFFSSDNPSSVVLLNPKPISKSQLYLFQYSS